MEDFDSRHFFSQLIDDYVGVEPSPTEKQRKWREVTRYRLSVCLSVFFFFSFYCWLFQTHSRFIFNCLICKCKCHNHFMLLHSLYSPYMISFLYASCRFWFPPVFRAVLIPFTPVFVCLVELLPRTQWCNCPWRMAWRVTWDTSRPRWDIYSIYRTPVFGIRCQIIAHY